MGKRAKRNKKFFNLYVENLIGIAIIIGFMLTGIFQLLMIDDNVRAFLNSTEKLEGINLSTNLSSEAKITIEVLGENSAKNTFLLIDGEPVANFSSKSINIEVKPNQLLEIDGTKNDMELYFRITDVSDNVIEPQKTSIIRVNKNIEKIGMVKLK